LTLTPTLADPSRLPDRKCRVLLMISSMDGGGSERQILLLLTHLSRMRFAPELLVLRRGGTLYDKIPQDVVIHCLEEMLPVHRIGWPGRIFRAQVAALTRLLIERRIDVVYDRTFHMTLIAGPAAKSVGVPRVSTVVSPPSCAVPLNAGRFISIKRAKLAQAYAQAQRVIAVSIPTAADTREYYRLRPAQVLCIPNPVDTAALDQAVATMEAPAKDSRYTIVCVGRMTVEKNQACAIKALAALRDHYPTFALPRLWLVGHGPLRKTLEELAKKLNVQNDVVFLGHKPDPAPWIAAADALCLPSLFEGFPNVMLEAMALGTPVIASDIGVVRSLGRTSTDKEDRGKDYVAIFRADDPLHLARKIRRLRINRTATYSRLTYAKRLARRTHAIESIVPRIERIMLQAINQRAD
jgi:glycosyltransferase involved in cell wall biosynthesis